ncbi:hypothetical protein [Candidimonas nitroreducens]|uniref:Uncharacterized protein n=1 Tax=Candidimonas nitroreducens TaxID=683354 RepID=A0A225ML73_9BURK|nr:hypothetical protein [Candidimonas nitroreducens]OWT61994.1 hypothetical protein CEY11_09295 [Candidimonas nitroreducens]
MDIFHATIHDDSHQISIKTSDCKSPDYPAAVFVQSGSFALMVSASIARELGQQLIAAADHYDARAKP